MNVFVATIITSIAFIQVFTMTQFVKRKINEFFDTLGEYDDYVDLHGHFLDDEETISEVSIPNLNVTNSALVAKSVV